jgi:hypothetical protein
MAKITLYNTQKLDFVFDLYEVFLEFDDLTA